MLPTELKTTEKSTLSKNFRLSGPNSLSEIERLQGLAIQPFIFALTDCLLDLDKQIGDDPYARGPNYKRDRLATGRLIQALGDAGYSCKGTPYWVNREIGEPTIAQIDAMRAAAVNCVPALRDRFLTLSGDKDVAERAAFEKRFKAFDNAIVEFGDMVGDDAARNFQRPPKKVTHDAVTGPDYMCSLE